ncbi:MAG: sugar transferase [Cypionkella sp.]
MMLANPDLPQGPEDLNTSTLVGPDPQRRLASKARRTLCGSVIALADAAGFAISIALISALAATPGLAPKLAVIGGAALCLNWLYGLYPSDRLHAQEILRRRTLTTVLLCVLIAAFGGAVFGNWRETPTAEVVLLIAVALQTPLRKIARTSLHRVGLWGTPTDFFSSSNLTPKLETCFAKHWQYGLIPASGRGAIAATSYLPDSQEAQQLRLRYGDVIVLADLPDMRVSGLNPADIGGAVGLWMGRSKDGGTSAVKRAIDLAIAIPALIMATPFVLLAAAAIWIVDPGPVHYVQEREGFRGRKLRVFKLRTMYRDAESRLQDLLRADPVANAEWQSHFKLRHDPRVLPVIGKFLRVASVDELPQLLNVISGEMSIVGPRPFPEYHLAAMPVEFRVKRRSVVPGITGLWQISARSDADIAQQQQLDEHYIDNQSIWLDLQIVLGTFAALVGRKGAY